MVSSSSTSAPFIQTATRVGPAMPLMSCPFVWFRFVCFTGAHDTIPLVSTRAAVLHHPYGRCLQSPPFAVFHGYSFALALWTFVIVHCFSPLAGLRDRNCREFLFAKWRVATLNIRREPPLPGSKTCSVSVALVPLVVVDRVVFDAGPDPVYPGMFIRVDVESSIGPHATPGSFVDNNFARSP
jgi:hypothetical protein